MPLFGPPNIEKLKEKRDAAGLIKALGDKDAKSRTDAAWVLWELRDAAGFERFAFHTNVKPWNLTGDAFAVRDIAPWALGEHGDERAVEPLIGALKDSNVDTVRSAAIALGKLGDARAVDPLIGALNETDNIVREMAAEALGNLGDGRAVEPLIHALYDGALDVAATAAEALGKVGDARAVGPLKAALKRGSGRSKDVGMSADRALGRLLENPNVQRDMAVIEAQERERREQDEAERNAMPSSEQTSEAIRRLETSEEQILKLIAEKRPASIDSIIEAIINEITEAAGLVDFGRGPLVSDAQEAARKAAGRYAKDHRDSLKGEVDPRPFADKLVRPALAAYLRVLKNSA